MAISFYTGLAYDYVSLILLYLINTLYDYEFLRVIDFTRFLFKSKILSK